MLPLNDDFEPGPNDVICGRGKKCYAYIGNERFRGRVAQRLQQYTSARTKDEKSHVVMLVVNEVREASLHGGFVKKNSSGEWYEVGDFLAREKTSQAFRDCLSDKYKSSTDSRRKKRQAERVESDPNKPSSPPKKQCTTVTSSDAMTLFDAASGMHDEMLKADVFGDGKAAMPIAAPSDGRVSELLQAPRYRRTSNISISKELLTDDILDFGIDTMWDDADHREHHSLPDVYDTPKVDSPGFEFPRARSVPPVSKRENSYSFSFIKLDGLDQTPRKGGEDDDAWSATALANLAAETPLQDLLGTQMSDFGAVGDQEQGASKPPPLDEMSIDKVSELLCKESV